ncbi:hypothetical protein NPS01_21220 [Nocardioides psychrotolerans]|nr:hypothetical protein NPS01_21220 [Nocardioides psychrotolerans]
MTMTLADTTRIDDGGVTPRADRPERRTFTAEYKAQILGEYEAADHGERGAILRREGLYSSHTTECVLASSASAFSALVRNCSTRLPRRQTPRRTRPPGKAISSTAAGDRTTTSGATNPCSAERMNHGRPERSASSRSFRNKGETYESRAAAGAAALAFTHATRSSDDAPASWPARVAPLAALAAMVALLARDRTTVEPSPA